MAWQVLLMLTSRPLVARLLQGSRQRNRQVSHCSRCCCQAAAGPCALLRWRTVM
jgi:hypothetical protein